MSFLGVYRAIYDYAPQAEGELTIGDGDLLYILEKNDDDGWWKAKKKASTAEEEEPEGLVPNNYVEPVPPLSHARAIYEYTRQTDEELSFPEDALLEIFDTSDPDWILAGHENEYGFVPSNYIEMETATSDGDTTSHPAPPALPVRTQSDASEQSESALETGRVSPSGSPAAARAGEMQSPASPRLTSTSPTPSHPTRHATQHDKPRASEQNDYHNEAPQPSASSSQTRSRSVAEDQPQPRSSSVENSPTNEPYRTPGGFHLYNINEMVSVMGKRKKMPTTLGINIKNGTILIAPEHGHDDPAQEWTADNMTHYSREGKHVFLELVRPSKSIDFHAGAKDTAEEIVGALGELAGAVRAEGLREVIMAGSQRRRRQGQILYDFMAQGDDEVTVAAGDEVVIVDDSKSDEWWHVRRVKNGKEGVVPSSYIEVTGTVAPTPAAIISPTDSVRSTIEQNRLEEIRLTNQAVRASKEPQQRSRREHAGSDPGSQSKNKSKPDASKVKTWTDRSGSFSVEAQFLGLKDGKIQLHKMNGVKIAVPVAKMSRGDLEYVESVSGISLDDDKPLADMKRSSRSANRRPSEIGASVEKKEKPEYDWFQFFLSCDVSVGLCERYAQAFIRDSMDESVLPDVNATILRTLGLREGDIIKVMRTLDAKLGRDRGKTEADSDNASGGLFSGPGGALRNNTRKGRPAPTVQTSDVVDATTLSNTSTPAGASSAKSAGSGFEDNAWDPKPLPDAQQQAPKKHEPAVADTGPALRASSLTGTMKDLSQLSEPLEPTRIEPQQTAQAQQAQRNTVYSPSFLSTGSEQAQSRSSPDTQARQRPTPSSMSPSQGSLMPPPPQRPLSAPQSAQQAMFGPPRLAMPPFQATNPSQPLQFTQPMMTGMQGSPFADPGQPAQFSPMAGQPTGLQPAYSQRMSMFPQNGGLSGYLPPPLEPQRTGMPPPSLHPQPTGAAGGLHQQPTGAAGGLHPQPTGAAVGGFAQPLQAQKTGPPPPVRFGVPADPKGLTPQATGRRANLAQATPDNPFGF